MFASVRRYRVDQDKMAEFTSRIPGAIEAMKRLTGFRAYYIVQGDNGWVAAVSVFSNADSAARSNKVAEEYVKANFADLLSDPRETITGEVLGFA